MGDLKLIAIFGPTGVGKTEIAVELGACLRAGGRSPVAVSADAMQVYRGMELLSGAASADEQALLEHRCLSCVEPSENFSAGRYAELAHREIDALIATGEVPIVVGGTGLYLRAALADLSLAPPPPPELRARWQAELGRVGPQALHARLSQSAPEIAATIAPTDSQRVVRALELSELGALPPPRNETSQLWTVATRHPTLLVGLTLPREELYSRIDQRVDAMVAAGARQEVERLAAGRVGETASKALGYSELLDGDVDAMKRHTRAYARRQLTWMRKLPDVWTLDLASITAAEAARQIADRFNR